MGTQERAPLKGKPLTYAAHVLAIAGSVMVLVWILHFRGGVAWDSTDEAQLFNLHPVLTLIGFIIIGGEATISYKSLPLGKEQRKLIHMVLHTVALIFGILGIYTAFKFHDEAGIRNLYSLHSWLGLGAIVLYAIQWAYGFVVFFYPGGSPSLRATSVPWHVILGMFAYSLAVGNAILGFLEKLVFLETYGVSKVGPEAYLVNFTAIATILYGVFVILVVYCQHEDQTPVDPNSYTAI
ncbi:hypothetical protein Droror1_Dr00009528 [Drosera rotundifolia]